jgi:hypothetical protein
MNINFKQLVIMRFIYFMMLFVGCAVSAQSLELKGVLDLTVPSGGNDGKALHLYVIEDIPNLSLYGIGVANNGGGSDGQEYQFPIMAASAGDHIFVPRTISAMTTYFGNLDSFDIVIEETIASQNGDDAIELFFNGVVIETFGDVDCAPATATDCPGFPNYTDAWAYKTAGVWSYAAANCTDNSTTSLTSSCPYPLLLEVEDPATPTQPSSPAATPPHAAADVISIYGDTYTSIVTNFDPNWGQTGHLQVNSTFAVDDDNVVLAYPNFNYQGTLLNTVNASAMEFLHVDIWTTADPEATDIQVSPISNGSGPAEILVSIDYEAGQWIGVDIPKSAFTGMNWNSIFQMKFAANAPGSLVPVTIYLDNIYFWKAPIELGADASLSDLQVDGTTISDFESVEYNYSFDVPAGSTDIPQITVTTTDANASTVITQATAVPGSATVVVTSQNEEVVNTYTVAFSFEVPSAPSTPAATPTRAAENVISIYGDTYTSIATNFDPNWGQTGHLQVNSTFAVDEGNVVLAYPNFNYQGTLLTTTNASAMEFLHVDIWTNANPEATTIQVSPINNGAGTTETLVTINHVAGQWYGVDIPKSAFTGMTWNSVFELKFAANAPGSVVPVTIYLDNIYFWKAPIELGADATLSDLQVGGTTIANFTAINTDYSFEIAQGSTDIPQITATTTDDGASTVITQATAVPGDATVVVTSQNGMVVNTYTVAFSFIIPTEPMTAAPMPTASPMDVLSMFSNAYTNVPVNTWLTVWSAAALTDLQIAGNDTKRYSNLNFAGIETVGDNTLDLNNAVTINMDIWTPNMTQFRVKLVDVGADNNFGGGDDSEHEVVIENPTQGEWVTVSIPLSNFTNLMARENIAQLIISGNPSGAGTVFVDNVYFDLVPTTKLRSSFCNSTLSNFNENVYADGVVGANAYRFKVVNGMNEQVVERPDTRFSMGFASGIMAGTTYSVTVAAQVDGTWGVYNTVCTLTTPAALPTTQLRTSFCNTTLTSLNQNIYANYFVGASGYRFKLVNNMNEQEIERPDSRFSMAFATGIMAGTTYSVSVALQLNGVWGDYGTVCTITTPATLPTTQLRSQFCNGMVSSLGSNFYAGFVSGATAYRFKTMINAEEVVVERPDSRCFMSAFAGAMMNQSYSIQVAVEIGGVWSAYGTSCNLTVGTMAPKLNLTDNTENFNITAYPNPFMNQITLSLSNENTQSDIMVYDMTGKLIQQVSTQETTLEIGNNWSKGIYLVQIVQGQETKNIRMVKQ